MFIKMILLECNYKIIFNKTYERVAHLHLGHPLLYKTFAYNELPRTTNHTLWRGTSQQPRNAIDHILEAFTLKDGGGKNMVGGSYLAGKYSKLAKVA